MTRKRRPATDYIPRTTGPAAAAESPVVQTKYGTIYPADVERVEYNYIQSLPDPDSIYNINSFIGLLFLLHREIIKPVMLKPGEVRPGTRGYDIRVLDIIFYNIFIPLIAKYHITPTIGMFMYLIGIDSSLIDTWKKKSNNIYSDSNDINNICISNDYSNSNSDDNNYSKYSYYLKWSNYIEQWILGNVVNTNSIGGMFALKAVYGYSDAQTIRIEAQETRPAINAAQLDRIAGEAAAPPEIGTN